MGVRVRERGWEWGCREGEGLGSCGEEEPQREGTRAAGFSRPLTRSWLSPSHSAPSATQTAKLSSPAFPLPLPTHLLEVFPRSAVGRAPETYTLEG